MSAARILTLTVSQDGRRMPPGLRTRHEFRQCGGSIGRSDDCDWVLAAPGISRTHAVIRYVHGLYFLEDRSTNGMLRNGAPLARGEPVTLGDGDRLQMDTFEVEVSLRDAEQAAAPPAPMGFDDDRTLAVPAPPPPAARPFEPPAPAYHAAAPAPAPAAGPLPGFDDPVEDLLAGIGGDGELDPLRLFDAPAPAPARTQADPGWNHTPGSADHFQPPRPAAPAPAPILPEEWDLTRGDFGLPPPAAVPAPVAPAPAPIPEPAPMAPAVPAAAASPAFGFEPAVPVVPPPAPVQAPASPFVGVPAQPAAFAPVPAPAPAPAPALDFGPDTFFPDPFAAGAAAPATAPAVPAFAPAPAAPAAPAVPVAPPAPFGPMADAAAPAPGFGVAAPAPAAPAPAYPPQPPVAAPPQAYPPAAAPVQSAAPAAAPAPGAMPAPLPPLPPELDAIFRIVVDGVMEVLRARAEIKNTFRLPVTIIQRSENNPLKFAATPGEAMQRLFQPDGAFLSGTAAFEDAFNDIRFHQVAMLAGMRAAFESLLAHFNPDRLEREVDGAGGRRAFSGKGRYWERYREDFARAARDPDECFRMLFGDEFAKAYETQLARLKSARRREQR